MSLDTQSAEPVEVFFSYATEDEPFLEQLLKHLTILKRNNEIIGWDERQIGAGKEWKEEIDEHLNSAGVILLLISSDFLASDYCYDTGVKRALERHNAGEARVIPVILRPCDWHKAPFGGLKCLPRNKRPVSSWGNNVDSAWLDVAQGVSRAATELAKQRQGKSGEQHRASAPASQYRLPGEEPGPAGLETQAVPLYRGWRAGLLQVSHAWKSALAVAGVLVAVLVALLLLTQRGPADRFVSSVTDTPPAAPGAATFDANAVAFQGSAPATSTPTPTSWPSPPDAARPTLTRTPGALPTTAPGAPGVAAPTTAPTAAPLAAPTTAPLVGSSTMPTAAPMRSAAAAPTASAAGLPAPTKAAVGESSRALITPAAAGSGPAAINAANAASVVQVKAVEISGYPHSLSFSPSGEKLAVAITFGVPIYDPKHLETPSYTVGGGDSRRVAFGSDGRVLATAGWGGGKISLWDIAAGGAALAELEGHTQGVNCLAFSPTGDLLASGGRDASLRVWEVAGVRDTRQGRMLFFKMDHGREVYAVAFSPDGATLASGGSDGKVRVWSVPDGQPGPVLDASSYGVAALAFSPDGKWLLSGGGSDGAIRLWDTQEWQPRAVLRGHTADGSVGVQALAFNREGTLLASAASDKTIRLWDMDAASPSYRTEVSKLEGHAAAVESVAFNPAGTMLVSASPGDFTIRTWQPGSAAGP